MRRKHNNETPTKPAPQVPVFTITELALRWRTSRNTVTAAIHAGRLHAFKIGERRYRISETEVLRFERDERDGLAVAS